MSPGTRALLRPGAPLFVAGSSGYYVGENLGNNTGATFISSSSKPSSGVGLVGVRSSARTQGEQGSAINVAGDTAYVLYSGWVGSVRGYPFMGPQGGCGKTGVLPFIYL